jgi:hypothetical protein
VSGLCSAGEYEAVLATHEQAWLFAAGRHLLPADAPIAVAPIEAFDRVAGKVEFAMLCDELGIPQPRWWRCDERPAQVPYPHWVKASYGTAGRAVRRVDTAQSNQALTYSSPHPAAQHQLADPVIRTYAPRPQDQVGKRLSVALRK